MTTTNRRLLWYIQGFDGAQQSLALRLPSKTSGKQVSILLQRLASRHLSPEQLADIAINKCHADTFKICISERSRISLNIGNGRYKYVAEVVSHFQLSEMNYHGSVDAECNVRSIAAPNF